MSVAAEALVRKGCAAITESKVSSAVVQLEDGTVWVAHPAFRIEPATPELIIRMIKSGWCRMILPRVPSAPPSVRS